MNNEATGSAEIQSLSNSAKKRLAAVEHNKTVNTTPSVPLTTEQRDELEALSKEVFGSTSRYATLLKKGEVVPSTITVTEYVPDENGGEGTTKEVEVVEKYRNSKAPILKLVRYTYDSLKARLLELKAQQDQIRALLAKIQADKVAEQEKAKLTQEVQSQLGGSAI